MEQISNTGLFSHISMTGAAGRSQPRSHRRTIAATTTQTGLTIHAELDTTEYPRRQKSPTMT